MIPFEKEFLPQILEKKQTVPKQLPKPVETPKKQLKAGKEIEEEEVKQPKKFEIIEKTSEVPEKILDPIEVEEPETPMSVQEDEITQ